MLSSGVPRRRRLDPHFLCSSPAMTSKRRGLLKTFTRGTCCHTCHVWCCLKCRFDTTAGFNEPIASHVLYLATLNSELEIGSSLLLSKEVYLTLKNINNHIYITVLSRIPPPRLRAKHRYLLTVMGVLPVQHYGDIRRSTIALPLSTYCIPSLSFFFSGTRRNNRDINPN